MFARFRHPWSRNAYRQATAEQPAARRAGGDGMVDSGAFSGGTPAALAASPTDYEVPSKHAAPCLKVKSGLACSVGCHELTIDS